jgi:hypothetical protein
VRSPARNCAGWGRPHTYRVCLISREGPPGNCPKRATSCLSTTNRALTAESPVPHSGGADDGNHGQVIVLPVLNGGFGEGKRRCFLAHEGLRPVEAE